MADGAPERARNVKEGRTHQQFPRIEPQMHVSGGGQLMKELTGERE